MFLLLLFAGTFAASSASWPLGDTLTVVMRPILGVPSIVAAGETLDVVAKAPPSTADWAVCLVRGPRVFPLTVSGAGYEAAIGLWTLRAPIPSDTPEELYDLALSASGGIADTTRRSVKVLDDYPSEWCFAHVTDTHLPGHVFSASSGWQSDSTEQEDLRAVIEDLNVIAPEFLLLTGDLINEGELEDYQGHRVYSRAQRLLEKLDVPVYLVTGNHDVGGWDTTPPPDGTARRAWWRFFGWPYLDGGLNGVTTENYVFDFGRIRFVGLEAYLNYDEWRSSVYGESSFLPHQLDFLRESVRTKPQGSKVVAFYHMDFADQIVDPAEWGIDLTLYGHIHRDAGSISASRPVLATESACDGNRAYRIVRVRTDRLRPRATLDAGSLGEKLTLAFDHPNDGTRLANGARIVNSQAQELEFAEVAFVMPKEGGPYRTTGAEIVRSFDADTALIVTARVPLDPGETARVSIDTAGAPPPPPPPPSLVLLGNSPNPFNGTTEIRFEIPEPGGIVEIQMFDVSGRFLFTLVRGPFASGPWDVPWDGRSPSGERLPAGHYFYRVLHGGDSKMGRLVYVR